jgi:glycosyltransferase involved in cell wall biosynthesis
MDFSIVVPFYDEEEHIEKCIQALLALDYPRDRYEILMVNNNSTDRSVEIVEAYPDAHLFHESKPGDFAARNLGVARAKGEFIAFTDSDTAPCSDWLTKAKEVFRNPEIALIVGNLQFSSNSMSMRLLRDYEAEKNRFIFSGEDPRLYYGYTCNMIVRRAVFDRLGPFPEIFRNSDAVYVRRVVDSFSCASVCYGEHVSVRRLEVASALDYLSKMHVYGRDLKRYARFADSRPLSMGERLHAFGCTVRRHRYSPLASAYLLALLGLGVISYDSGRLRGGRS